ncbi:MAG: DegV family protein [Lachnospiraceae bacterium]|uniref:DegV family protein n=1 Tax=Candidatus Enterocloster excrementigallinarum TaxID=2838558 RepID=A0A9D2TD60_9FIRM|nr:DegV family protein [Lachnospiraceae bacterium]HJC65574.1 DegV family protein [Candidatus Enterocloster excrementigallinarum]
MYAITCCSTADLPAQFYEKTGISYAKFHFSMNGVEYDDDLGLSISPEEFYQQIRQGALPVTSQVNVQQYEDLFEPILRSGKDLIHLTLSSGISGSIGSARIAARELSERYPNRRIQIIDSLAAASGYGLLVEEAYCRQQEGMSFDQLVSWIEENKLKLHHWFFSTDLTHFRRGGRISASSAFFGNMLNICPLMNVNSQGKLVPREKIRGKKRVMGQMLRQMELHAQEGLAYKGRCFICHSDCASDARELAAMVEQAFPSLDGPVEIFPIGTVIGSHTGPGTVALFFWGDERTL